MREPKIARDAGGRSPAPESGEPLAGIDTDVWLKAYRRATRIHGTVGSALGYFTRIFEEAPAPYIVTTPQLIIADANLEAQSLMKRQLAAVRGKPLQLIVAPSDRTAFRTIASDLLASQDKLARPLKLQYLSGAEFDVVFHARVIRNEMGDPQFIYWLFLGTPAAGFSDFL